MNADRYIDICHIGFWSSQDERQCVGDSFSKTFKVCVHIIPDSPSTKASNKYVIKFIYHFSIIIYSIS